MAAIFDRSVKISEAKSADYAGDEDAFANFRVCENYGVPAEAGFITRMSDKMSRVSNLIGKEAKVTDEKIEDTLLDLANYSVLFLIFLEEKYGKQEPKAPEIIY